MQVEIKVPQLPESVTEGTLGDWHKKVGDSVAVDENIVDLETDKVVLEIVASKAGVIKSIEHETGAVVKAEEVLGVIDTEASASAGDAGSSDGDSKDGGDEDSSAAGKASPAVRKLLNEHNLNADDIEGSGKKGAILKADVEKYLKQQKSSSGSDEPAAKQAPAAASTPPARTITGTAASPR